MLRTLLVGMVLLGAQPCFALSCVAPSPVWWPPGQTAPSQPFVVLSVQGKRTSMYDISTAVFRAEGSIVPATVEHIDRYTIIRPERPLEIGQTYTLEGRNDDRFKDGFWRQVGRERLPVRWTIAASTAAIPSWTDEIRVGESQFRETEWGDISSRTLHLSFKGEGPLLAEVKLSRRGQQHTIFLPVEKDKPLRFGQGLCGGEINLAGGGVWEAEVRLVTPDGRRSAPRTARFGSPSTFWSCSGCAHQPGEGGSVILLLFAIAFARARRRSA
jgi:hypothetical protein